ncbi:MAG: hypothetical protein JW757_05635 [Anaerolineales bacterium]|nr:hypothetical protein [Anaerolineales bacterium]
MSQSPEKFQPFNPNQQPRRRLIWLILLSALIGLGVFFLVALWFYPAFMARIAGLAVTDMAILEGFTSLMTLAALSGGFVFWVIDRQQKEEAEEAQEKTLSFQLFQTIHDRLVDPEQVEARRWIISSIPIKPDDQAIEEWFAIVSGMIEAKPAGWAEARSPGQINIKRVLNNFDFIGFVAEHFWNAHDADIDWLSPPVAKVWRRLGPYVRHLGELRKEPDYYQAADKFGEYCIQWREKKGLQESEYVEGL